MMVIATFIKTYLKCPDPCLTILPLKSIVPDWMVEGSIPAKANNLEAEEKRLKSPTSPII